MIPASDLEEIYSGSNQKLFIQKQKPGVTATALQGAVNAAVAFIFTRNEVLACK